MENLKIKNLTLNVDNSRRKILILSTGGTIEKIYDEAEGSLSNKGSVILKELNHKLRLPYVDLRVEILLSKDSLNLTPEDRKLILDKTISFMSLGIPIVILHGTDTMEFSANFLKQHIKKIKIPIIFTGAMRPLEFTDSDTVQNVCEALYAAQLCQPDIYISFHNRLYRVPGVKKNHTTKTFETYSNKKTNLY